MALSTLLADRPDQLQLVTLRRILQILDLPDYSFPFLAKLYQHPRHSHLGLLDEGSSTTNRDFTTPGWGMLFPHVGTVNYSTPSLAMRHFPNADAGRFDALDVADTLGQLWCEQSVVGGLRRQLANRGHSYDDGRLTPGEVLPAIPATR
jgi:hypothetical protein